MAEPRGPWLGVHWPYMTNAEEQLGYPKARECLKGYETKRLQKEWLQAVRDSLGMFPNNARINANLLADELLARGCDEIPNSFGAIKVRKLKS